MLTLASGLPRSGTTWLYNAARLLMGLPDEKRLCGWFRDVGPITADSDGLLKLHYFQPELAQAGSTLYAIRDMRDVLASYFRKFDQIPTAQTVQYFLTDFAKWKPHVGYWMRYERMIDDPAIEVGTIARHLGVICDPFAIADSIAKMNHTDGGQPSKTYNPVNLLHDGHITDGRVGSWVECEHADKIDEIAGKCLSPWLREFGYL